MSGYREPIHNCQRTLDDLFTPPPRSKLKDIPRKEYTNREWAIYWKEKRAEDERRGNTFYYKPWDDTNEDLKKALRAWGKPDSWTNPEEIMAWQLEKEKEKEAKYEHYFVNEPEAQSEQVRIKEAIDGYYEEQAETEALREQRYLDEEEEEELEEVEEELEEVEEDEEEPLDDRTAGDFTYRDSTDGPIVNTLRQLFARNLDETPGGLWKAALRAALSKARRNGKFDEDLYQSAMEAAWANIGAAEASHNPEAYMVTVVINAIHKARSEWVEIPQSTLYRNKQGKASQKTSAAILGRTSICKLPDSYELVQDEPEPFIDLFRVIDSLPDDQAEIVRLFYGFERERLPETKIAAKLGWSRPTIRKKHQEAKDTLREMLKEQLPEAPVILPRLMEELQTPLSQYEEFPVTVRKFELICAECRHKFCKGMRDNAKELSRQGCGYHLYDPRKIISKPTKSTRRN